MENRLILSTKDSRKEFPYGTVLLIVLILLALVFLIFKPIIFLFALPVFAINFIFVISDIIEEKRRRKTYIEIYDNNVKGVCMFDKHNIRFDLRYDEIFYIDCKRNALRLVCKGARYFVYVKERKEEIINIINDKIKD